MLVISAGGGGHLKEWWTLAFSCVWLWLNQVLPPHTLCTCHIAFLLLLIAISIQLSVFF